MSSVRTLAVRLDDLLVGYLTRFPDERTLFVVDAGYVELGVQRPIFSLSMARPNDDAATRALLLSDRHKAASVKSPPFFSNLLPEGGLRTRIAQRLKVHEDREFSLLAALGEDLPGAVVLVPAETPPSLQARDLASASTPGDARNELKFSIGGMQMKFSMLRQGERYTLAGHGQLGNYIVKPPSRDFPALPLVEAATMETARSCGMTVPEVLLLSRDQFEGPPDLLGEQADEPSYAIRRFDRTDDGGRRHAEDFAQVFNLRPQQKYSEANYEMIGRTLLQYAGGLDDLKEMARRLMLNVLLGNGDAHVKNWSLLYDNPLRPRLSPAYDLVSTVAYMTHDTSVALNMGKVKAFESITLATFDTFFLRIGVLDQAREEAMAVVRETGRRILDLWGGQFAATGVPRPLVRRVEEHQARLPMVRELGKG